MISRVQAPTQLRRPSQPLPLARSPIRSPASTMEQTYIIRTRRVSTPPSSSYHDTGREAIPEVVGRFLSRYHRRYPPTIPPRFTQTLPRPLSRCPHRPHPMCPITTPRSCPRPVQTRCKSRATWSPRRIIAFTPANPLLP